MRSLACFCLALSAVLLTTVVNAATSTLEQTRLIGKLEANPSQQLSVIVRYDNLAVQSKTAHNAPGGKNFKALLLQSQQRILEITQARQSGRIRNYSTVPLSALRVNRSTLVDLLNDSSLTVFEDKIKRPSLAQSVPRVYPSRNSSPFHGNNQWTVAILDSGVDKNHPHLTNKVVSEACYSDGGGQPLTESLCAGGVNSSTLVNSGVPCTITGCDHGTMLAGIAAGDGTSQDGVARDAKIISIQVYSQINDEAFCFPNASCLGAYTSDLIAGMERVYALRSILDIAAVNLSLGSEESFSGTCDEQPEKLIIDQLVQAKIAVIAATGNSGNTSMMGSPACISSAIAVAATFDNADIPWNGNNTSTALDLFAPGVNINSPSPGGGFSAGTGTSFAVPHVAGAWAVLRHADPALSVTALKNILKSSGPLVSQNSIARRRLDLTSALAVVAPNVPNTGLIMAPIIMLLSD